MDLEPLTARYFRLRQELAIAYRSRPWQSARIDRLANDLSATEREIGALQAGQPGQWAAANLGAHRA
jgi:hypothetical protein